MITEDYVSFETAKLLKEKGFDCPCKVWYAEYTSVWGGDPSGDRKYINIQFDDKNRFDEYYKFLCNAPTLQMAMKWLREAHKIFLNINFIPEHFCFTYRIVHHGVEEKFVVYPSTYEEACEAAIRYCLENLI